MLITLYSLVVRRALVGTARLGGPISFDRIIAHTGYHTPGVYGAWGMGGRAQRARTILATFPQNSNISAKIRLFLG